MVPILVATSMLNDSFSLEDMLSRVDPKRLKATVEKLASYPTRNTLSPHCKESCEWLASEMRKIPGLQVELWKYTLKKSRRVPKDQDAYEVIATLPGKTDRTILVGGHIDSLNLKIGPLDGPAPGANDDASGVALVLELATVLSGRQYNQTLKFVAFSGEEQGLLGSAALAERAKAENWKLEAVFSNDTVGSSSNSAGRKDAKHVRIFSDEQPEHESRELARWIDWRVRETVKGFGISLVLRKDRFGRGGDHTPFAERAYSAVRFIEVCEEFTRQHTPEDLPKYMDFGYLANVTRANLSALIALAECGPQPESVHLKMDQGPDTTLLWKKSPGVQYRVYWRRTVSATWEGAALVGAVDEHTIRGVNKDDHFFGVGADGGIPVVVK